MVCPHVRYLSLEKRCGHVTVLADGGAERAHWLQACFRHHQQTSTHFLATRTISMAPQSFKFDLQTMQNCLEYLSDSLDWLNNIDDHEMFRVSQEIDLSYDFLAERIQSLVYAIRRIQNRHSAINRLPSEILGAIFEALMPSYPRLTFDERDSDSDSEDDIIGYSPPPWVSQTAHAASSLVCQHWRNVILTTPALWTDIIIPHRALSRDGNSRHGDFISSQLARSGIRSLDVQFNGMFSPASLQLTFVQDLLKQVHRIRRLSIRLQAMNDDIRMWTANARRLEILKISALYDTSCVQLRALADSNLPNPAAPAPLLPSQYHSGGPSQWVNDCFCGECSYARGHRRVRCVTTAECRGRSDENTRRSFPGGYARTETSRR
ncbi:hypothetical protein BDW22DRAFT_926699 [Trametopsis cervina]|nr:hypothetical protein BDW22DRAFT_926699 [Trametopsis cervina]